uniref:CAAX prenyl protease 2/Lysostaphin resistance protein A-like domain-containing protein n=1 Tax=Thermosporothrix sp. COM3 TaxID=2490863 RepID=A0A455SH20_9CHLR|nr:hypothetical protein KTC_09800 [Thermosporothrix sp. COM3]
MKTDVLPRRSEEFQEKPNSIEALKQKVRDGRIRPLWPLLMNFIRLPLVLIGILLAYLIFSALHSKQAFSMAMLSSNVTITFTADLVCVLLLRWLTHREGLRLRDLFGIERNKLLRDILLGLLLFVLLFVCLYIANTIAALLVYGPTAFSTPQSATSGYDASTLPIVTGIFLFSTFISPLTIGIAEELTYRAYAFPRLIALTGRLWPALLLSALGFGVQHIAFALTGWQDALARFLGMFLMAPVFCLLYLKMKRLLPLVIGHWLVDAVGLGLFPLLFLLTQQ